MLSKKSFIGLFLILIFIPSVSMEDSTNGIFRQFIDKYFVDYCHDFLFRSKKGRLMLLQSRVGELIGVNILNHFLSQILTHTNVITIANSVHYGDGVVNVMHYHSNTKFVSYGTTQLCIFAAGIIAIEKAFIEVQSMSAELVKKLENDRKHDLYLLKTILETDNSDVVRDSEPYLLPNLFAQTHQSWPPAPYFSYVHPVSGYQVVYNALACRQFRNIDFIDEN
ncbi:MAG: hypothetical protein WC707_03105 [Candidatus Babeliaceae bacterium]|jgi:hypothetical protein